MDKKELTSSERKTANVLGGIIGGATMGCLVGGSVLLALVVLVALVRLLGWLVGL